MKQSTAILIGTILLAIAWIVAFYWMAGISIRDIRSGKTPRFAIAPPPADEEVVLDPGAYSSLDISGCQVMVVVSRDSMYRIILKDHLKKGAFISLSDSILHIRFLKINNGKTMDTVFFCLPRLKSLTMYSYKLKNREPLGLAIKNLDLPDLKIYTNHVSPLVIRDCRISSFILEAADDPAESAINVPASNHFDSLTINIPGPATLELGAAGLYKNDLHLSGSVKIQSTARILGKINLIPNQ
jgi:hypothetical protein